jgi:hypothetical protein
VNAWGYFICRKLAKPFLPVTRPRGYERQRLLDAHYQRNRKCRKASHPLPPEVLNEVRGKMNQANQLKNEVELASKIVETIINKYISNIKRIDSSHYSVREFEKFLKESEEFIKKEEKNKNLNKYLIIGFIAFAILLIISGAKSELFLLSIIGACIWFVKAVKK